jgi:hypothetical protein
MAGVLAWHRATPRYTGTGLRATYLGFQRGPTGLGTAAALAGAMSRGADTLLNRG